MATKEELQRQLAEIQEKETAELIDKHFAEFKAFEGKCFKYKNRYSDGDSWWLYTKVVSVSREDVYRSGDTVLSSFKGWRFQTDIYGQVSVETENFGYIHSLGEEITEKAFQKAWKSTLEKLGNLP